MAAIQPDEIEVAAGRISLPPWPFLETLPAALDGEDRIAAAVRRDPGVVADVLCKSLLEAARDFSNGPINDDVAIMAVRRE